MSISIFSDDTFNVMPKIIQCELNEESLIIETDEGKIESVARDAIEIHTLLTTYTDQKLDKLLATWAQMLGQSHSIHRTLYRVVYSTALIRIALLPFVTSLAFMATPLSILIVSLIIADAASSIFFNIN